MAWHTITSTTEVWIDDGVDRSGLVYGQYRPDESTTGVLPGVPREVVHGDVKASHDGETISDLTVYGRISTNNKAGVTFSNIEVIAPPADGELSAGTYDELFDGYLGGHGAWVDGDNARLVDCTIRPRYPSVHQGTAVWGFLKGGSVERCHLRGWVDGISLSKQGGLIAGNLIDESPFYAEPWRSDRVSHNDGVQIFAGSGYRLVGNVFDMPWGGVSCIGIFTSQGPVSDVVIERNWMLAGGSGINAGDMDGLQVMHNRFGPRSAFRSNLHGLIAKASRDPARGWKNIDNTVIDTDEVWRIG